MKETLDMIPVIFFRKKIGEKWEESNFTFLLDAEYVDEDLVNLNMIGHSTDYQVQFKLSSFLGLLKARGIPLQSSGGSQ